METKWIDVTTADGPMHAYLAEPGGAGLYPGIVVVQEAFGVNEYVRSVVDRLADAGYVALAPELYHRTGKHIEIAYDQREGVLEILSKIDNNAVSEDIGSAVAAVRARPDVDPKRIGIIGFCMGGFATILGGLTTAAAAIVAFYPGGLVNVRPQFKLRPLVDRIHTMRAATLCIYGADDHGIPEADINAVREALAKSPSRHRVTVYPNAGHGFHSYDRAGAYAPVAAEKAWHETLDWFATNLA